jgi:hypothetical protein
MKSSEEKNKLTETALTTGSARQEVGKAITFIARATEFGQ